MTTRAGTSGLLTGLLITLILGVFMLLWPREFFNGIPDLSAVHFWIADVLLVVLTIAGSFRVVRREGVSRRWRGIALGALVGGLAGMVVFCLWGATVTGATSRLLDDSLPLSMFQYTLTRFWLLFGGGALPGALGGLTAVRPRKAEEVFNHADPQMAMNAAITALPACVFTAALAAAFTFRLSVWPLNSALVLALLSHYALIKVVPHETRQAEHRCGTDEVKMAVFVSIAAAPVTLLLLLLIAPECFRRPFINVVLIFSLAMSLKSLRDLIKVVLPKRASFPAPDDSEKAQAVWFGSIAESKAGRLIVLCTGCGLAMVMPLYVCLLAPALNLAIGPSSMMNPQRLFLAQAGASLGISAAAVAALCLIYLLYLKLGKRFSAKTTSKD
jgi:hypothetical protein